MNKITVLAMLLVFAGFACQLRAADVGRSVHCKKKTEVVKKKTEHKKVKKVKKEKKVLDILKLTEADAGKAISVDHKKYKKIEIELGRALVSQGNITAWSYGNHTGTLCYMKHKKVEPQKGLMGSAGTDVFSFKIKGPGIATVDIGHEEQLPDGKPSNRLIQPPSVHFEFDIK